MGHILVNSKTYRNIIFTFVGIMYFIIYYHLSYDYIVYYFTNKIIYGDYIISYFNAIIGMFTSIGIIGIFIKIFQKIVDSFFDSNREKLFFLDILYGFMSFTKYFISLFVFIYFAIVPAFVEVYLHKFYFVSIIVVVVYYITKFINKYFEKDLLKRAKLKTQSKTLFPFLNKVIVVFIWIVGVITIFDNLGYNISALIAGAGIGGLAIAFAAQKSISNMFGAINILLNKPFSIGDYVRINGVTGTVKDIGLSYLTIIDKLGHQVMIPNEVIISNNVENFSIRENRRTDFSIGVAFGTSLEKMQEGVSIIESILEEEKELGFIGKYRVNFDMFGEFSLNIQATYFSLLNDSIDEYVKQKEKINLEIKNRFKKAGVEMAFPTRELIIKKES
ncbi:mechanosensitive ion channel family protein [Candidatus Gracilibacteria bacterium]|nr:mechanosensitive ion channel family protein [Candidatus Gracilibacteria bacterium]